ncbi:MAG: hypothetical protein JKX68_08120 [Flavobacteriales bacterium]|nr:hypothetical protein [Flavobacteriales bacterium]
MYNNVDFANIGDAAGLQNSAAAGSFFIALFTAAPGEAGGGTEATFGAYARQAVARTAGGWTVAGNNVSNAAEITFPEATSGSETVTHFAIMTAITSGDMLNFAALDTSRLVTTGVTVKYSIGALDVTED